MDLRTRTNRGLWDGWAALHASSAFYDLSGFRRGKSSLKPTERAELGPVDGKRLLHLQCPLGLDTLSWARLDAEVTGVDFSEPAIAQARALARDCDLPARFVWEDVLELDSGERFDTRTSRPRSPCASTRRAATARPMPTSSTTASSSPIRSRTW